MIIKNELPILEYDTESLEVVVPNHDCLDLHLPEKCVFAFIGSKLDEWAISHGAKIVQEFVTIAQNFKVYVCNIEGIDICMVQSPIGAPAAAQLLDTLVTCGCKKVIATGSCGVLADIPGNAFLVPTKALRDEGTSYQYLPASRFIELDEEAVDAISKTFDALCLPYEKCITWSTDGFFRETKDMVSYRLSEGCKCVEMECASLAACTRKRGGKFGQFLFTADSLANVHEYDARDFGYDSHEKALLLAIEILKRWN